MIRSRWAATLVLLAWTAIACAQVPAGSGPLLPTRIQRAIGCLVSDEFVKRDVLGRLDLRVGDSATVRFHEGSISGTTPTRDLINIVIYARDGLRAWLLFVAPEEGHFTVVHNGYQLTARGSGWQAGEGNGGLGTYAAVARFAAQLATAPAYRVRLIESRKNCGDR